MNPNKALWEKGDQDYQDCRLDAPIWRGSVVKSLNTTPPLRVLDLGCGDGTTAVPRSRGR